MSMHNKKGFGISAIIIALIAVVLVGSIALFTDHVNETLTFTIAAFTKDGYTLKRTAPNGYFTAGETVSLTVKETNAKDEPVETSISMSATWTSPDPDSKLWGQANAEDNAILMIDGESIDYTISETGSISFTLPQVTLAAGNNAERELTLQIPSTLLCTGNLSFSFDGVTVQQSPSGWSNEYSHDELNEAEDLDFSVGVIWNISKDQSTKDIVAYLTGNPDSYGLEIIKNGKATNTNQSKMMDFVLDKSGDTSEWQDHTNQWISSAPWTSYRHSITDVRLPEELTSVGSGAFLDFTGWVGVLTLPNNVSTVGHAAFGGCSGITAISIPDSVKTIESYAFANCTSVKTIILGAGLTELTEKVFFENTSLESIDWGNSNIVTIGLSAFEFAGQTGATLNAVSFPDSVKSIGPFSFAYTDALQTLELNNVQTIGYRAFERSLKMTELTIPATVSSIGEIAFYNCRNLTDITFEHSESDALTLPDPQIYPNPDNPEEILFRGAFNVDTIESPLKTNVYAVHPAVKEYKWIEDYRLVKGEPVIKYFSKASTEAFQAYKATATKITVMDHYDLPATVDAGPWDISAAGDESVMAYMIGTEIYICSNVYSWDDTSKNVTAKVIANEDSSFLFYDFSNVIEIDAENLDTSRAVNMDCMFASAENEVVALQTAKVSTWDVSNVERMEYMFSGCTSLITLDVSNWNVGNVTTMTDMFAFCHSISYLDVANWDVSNVENFNWLFHECESLTSIPVDNWDTQSMTTAKYMFFGCKNLINLNIIGFKTALATDMCYMFAHCEKLTVIDVSNFQTSNVERFNDMFWDCSALAAVDVSGFNTSKAIDMANMFDSCSSLVSLDLSSFDTRSITSADGLNRFAFDCPSLTTIKLGTNFGQLINVPSAGFDNGMFYVPDYVKTTISGANDIMAIGVYDWVADGRLKTPPTLAPNSTWYQGSTNRNTITTIHFVDSYTPSGNEIESWNADEGFLGEIKCYVTGTVLSVVGNGTGKIFANADSSYLFSEQSSYGSDGEPTFSKVTTITGLDYIDTSNMTNMQAMFANCYALQSIDVSTWDTSSVTNMRDVFWNCDGVTTLDLSSWDTSNVTTMWGLFVDCNYLTSIVGLENFDTRNVTDMGKMFNLCYRLESVNLSSFDTSKVKKMQWMFNECRSLTKLDVSGFDTRAVINSEYPGLHQFAYNCLSLTEIILGDNFGQSTNIPEAGLDRGMFYVPEYLETEISGANNAMMLGSYDWFADNREAVYAMLYDDGSMVFQIGNTQDTGKTLVDSWHGIIDTYYSEENGVYPEWYVDGQSAAVTTVEVRDSISPVSTAGWFYGMTNLQTADLRKLDMSRNTNMDNMFALCRNLTSILGMDAWDTQHVTSFRSVFRQCSSITDLSAVSNWDVSSSTSFNSMFSRCASITSLDLSSWDTSNATIFSWMFDYTDSLESVDVSNFDTSNGVKFEKVFDNAISLKSLDLTNWDTSGASTMENFFSNMLVLESVTLGNKFSFTGDGSTSCVLPTPSSTYIDGADGKWYNTSGTAFEPADVPSNVADTYTAISLEKSIYAVLYDNGALVYQIGSDPAEGMLLYASDSFWPAYAEDGTGFLQDTYVFAEAEADRNYAPWYQYGTSILSVRFDVAIKPTDMTMWYFDLPNVVQFDFTNLNTAAVISFERTFCACTSLTSLDVSRFDTHNANNMADMFSWCENLTVITGLSGFVTDNVTKMNGMFFNNYQLNNIDLSTWNTANVTLFNSMFEDCRSLTNLNVGGLFSTASGENFSSMFVDCSALVNLDLSTFDTRNAWGMEVMFDNMTSLEVITLGEAFTFAPDGLTRLCTLPDAQWVAASDGTVYGRNEIPNLKADTYTKYS